MHKNEFYIFQEDLVKYKPLSGNITVSQLVEDLNMKFAQANMKKLRTELITGYLLGKGYLFLNDEDIKRPTKKGNLLGITVGFMKDKNGINREVNLYNKIAQQYILDNLYEMIFANGVSRIRVKE